VLGALLRIPPRVAGRVAYFVAGSNLVAAAAMGLFLRPGLPAAGSSPFDRLQYLRSHTALWRGAWLFWHAAALGLLAFFIVLALRWLHRAPVRSFLALVCASAGLAADLAAQGLLMGLAPVSDELELPIIEAASGLLTGYVGNGLYTVAGILLTWAGASELPRRLLLLSVPVWGSGLFLSAASLIAWEAGQFWGIAMLMPLFVIWSFLVGRWLRRLES